MCRVHFRFPSPVFCFVLPPPPSHHRTAFPSAATCTPFFCLFALRISCSLFSRSCSVSPLIAALVNQLFSLASSPPLARLYPAPLCRPRHRLFSPLPKCVSVRSHLSTCSSSPSLSRSRSLSHACAARLGALRVFVLCVCDRVRLPVCACPAPSFRSVSILTPLVRETRGAACYRGRQRVGYVLSCVCLCAR